MSALRLPALLAIVVAMTSVAACPADPRAGATEPVAKIGKAHIDQQELLAVLSQRGVARVQPEQRVVVAEQILERLIDEELMLQAADKAGLVVSSEAVDREMRARTEGYPAGSFLRVLGAEQLTVDAFREGVRRRLVQDAFLRARLATLPAITDAEVEARYASTVGKEQRPAQVRARQVLLRTPEEARHVVEQVRTRKLTMEQAAQRFSQGMEASEGGDLGWFAEGDLPAVFDNCFLLEPGQVSDPIASDYGFHVFVVLEKRPARIEPLATVRDQIFDALTREQQAVAADALVVELRKETKVKIADEGIARVLALLPEKPPVTPIENVEQGSGRALDSHYDGADPIPLLQRE